MYYRSTHCSKGLMNKMQRYLRVVLAIIVLVSCFSFSTPSAHAAKSGIFFNVSTNACTQNADAPMPNPAEVVYAGQSYYINMAATSDFKLDRYELYFKREGESYRHITTYDTSGYFRWHNVEFTMPTSAGTYYFYPVLTTLNGQQYGCEIKCTVTGRSNSAPVNSTKNTYSYNGSVYQVVPNFNTKYCYNQYNYSRFVNSAGKNRGCTATAMCTAYSIYHNQTLSPNNVKWSSAGTSWEYAQRYGNRSPYNYSDHEALQCAYNSIRNDGKPMLIGVYNNGDHMITAVGIRNGADYNNLSYNDILIVDPLGGEICTLGKYSQIDRGWSLRVPIG